MQIRSFNRRSMMTRKPFATAFLLLMFVVAMGSTASCAPDIERLAQKQNVKGLIRALDHREYSVRRDAAQALGTIGDPRAVEPLITALDERSPLVREAAAQALGTMGDPRAAEPLITALKDKEESVREAAADALVGIGDPAVELLTIALKDEEASVRETAAATLDLLGWKPDDSEAGAWYWAAKGEWMEARRLGSVAVEALVATLKEDRIGWASAAARTLGAIGDPRAVEPLIAALEHGHGSLVSAAAEALGVIGDPRAVEPLIAALERGYTSEVAPVAEALGAIGDPRAVEPLIAALENRNSPRDAKPAIAEALGALGDPRAVEPLIAALQDFSFGSDPLRAAAAEALGALGDPRAVEPLIAILPTQAAAEALGVLGDPQAVRPLLALFDQRDAHMRDLSVLLPELQDRSTVGVYRLLIALGERSTEPALLAALKRYGHDRMAADYQFCGNDTLEAAGRKWASDRGYRLVATAGPQWGSFRIPNTH
jgi:HEAT repeat protein